MRFTALLTLLATPAFAGDIAIAPKTVPPLTVTLESLTHDGPIRDRFAFCGRNGAEGVGKGGNASPAIRWSDAPANTQSYAVIMVDPDVPTSFDLANQEGKIIPADLPRRDFYHWVLVNIPSERVSLPQGADGDGVQPHGKAPGQTQYGLRGLNDYTTAYKGDPKMDGAYGGYDGPCPPWNDARLHRYHFKVFALNVRNLNLQGSFDGRQAMQAISTHVLAAGEVVGTYTANKLVAE